MTTVRVTSGPAAGESVRLDRELTIGREEADLTIPDPKLSRHHVVIRPVSGGVLIEDLGSTNGTVVDGQRITAPRVLGSNGTVVIGDTTLEIALDQHAEQPFLQPPGGQVPDATRIRQAPVPAKESPQPGAAVAAAPVAEQPATRKTRRIPAAVPWVLAAAGAAAAIVLAVTHGSSTKTVTRTVAIAPATSKSGPTICPSKGVCLTTLGAGVIKPFSAARQLLGGPLMTISIGGPVVVSVRRQTIAAGAVFPWHRHPGSALVVLTQGKAEEVTAVGSGCHKEIHTPGYTRWEGGNESHTLINVGKVPVVIDVMSFDPVGNNQPVIPTSKPPNCSL